VISVKISFENGDWERGFDLVLEDLKARPDRQRRSVVLSAQGIGGGFTYEFSKASQNHQEAFGDPLKVLFSMGVPFVSSAGNAAGGDGKKDRIDTLPGTLADKELPIITVGAAT